MDNSKKTSFSQSLLQNTYDLETLPSINESLALSHVVADIDELLALNSNETKSKRHNYFDIPGTSENNYTEFLFELDSSRVFLAGIRHAGGNPELPFISITPNFAVTKNNLPEIIKITQKEFQAFQPQYLTFWINSKQEKRFPESQFKLARRYLVRKIKDLDLTLNNSAKVEVKPLVKNNYFPWYEDEYQKFHKSNPSLRSWVTVSEQEDLDEYKKQNLLYGAYLNNELVGIIGAEEQNLLGLTGLYIGELLIAEKYKGRGFATEMQKQFIKKVANRFELVWGTIDARNIPSTKTALRVGRLPMRTELFFPLS